MPNRNWRARHAPNCHGEKEFVRSAALALRTFKPADDPERGSWVCPPCKMLERGTAYKYDLALRLGRRPATYEDLLAIMRASSDGRVPGKQPAFIAQKGRPEALIAAREAGRGGLAGPERTKVSIVATWSRRDAKGRWTPPAMEVDLCQVCDLLLIRGTSRGARRVLAHQRCWWEVQRSQEGRAWMTAYMSEARSGRRSAVASRPYRPTRSGRRSTPETLTRHFGWAVRHGIAGETFAELSAAEHVTSDAVEKGVRRILELLPPVNSADRTMRRYLAAFDRAAGRQVSETQPLRRSVAECGTAAGYKRHRRRNEPACDACAQAERDRTRAYSEQRRREAGIKPRVAGESWELPDPVQR